MENQQQNPDENLLTRDPDDDSSGTIAPLSDETTEEIDEDEIADDELDEAA